jgi:hypothetical protein
MIEMGRSFSQNGGSRSAFKMLIDKPTGKRPLERPRYRWEDNIRIDLKGICVNTRNKLIRLRKWIIGEPL